MKLREFIEGLNEFVKKYPESLNMRVITADDDEGNGFHDIVMTPSIGDYDDSEEIFTELDSEDWDSEGYRNNINTVCIN